MKKGWKIFWVVCGVTVCIGVFCLIAGTAMGATTESFRSHFPYGIGVINFADGYSSDYGYGEQPSAEDIEVKETFSGIKDVEVDVTCLMVQVLESDSASGEIRMETSNIDPRLRFEYSAEGDTLEIKTREWKNFWRFGTNLSNGVVWLYVPKDMLEEVSMEIGIGELYVENISAKSFSVDAGVGEAVIDNFMADEADFNCGVGSITAAGDCNNSVKIDGGVGEVVYTAAGKEQDYNYSLDCGIGDVEVGGSSFTGLGTTKHIDNGAKKEMDIECGIGSVYVSFMK